MGKREGRKKPSTASGSNDGSLTQQLRALGLRVVPIQADGNCLFRAIAEQVHGPQGDHAAIRTQVVQFLREHEEHFAPFVENDETFHSYTQRMSTDGTWGSHMEIQAAAQLLRCNFTIHQVGQPRWELMGVPNHPVFYHLAYRDGEHYDSVRRVGDVNSDKAAVPFAITSTGHTDHIAAAPCDGEGGGELAAVERLLYCTGCTNATHAQQVLRDMEGDEDAAMEALIAGQGAALPCIPLPPPQQQMRTELPPSKQTVAVAEPKPNSRCTCGSKKKYKSCCGTGRRGTAVKDAAMVKSAPELLVSQVAALRL